jgi:hypothetical protein
MLEIWESPQSTQKTLMVGRLGGGAGDAGAPTINAKKRRWRAPWEAVPEIQERPTSTLRIVDDSPPVMRYRRFGSAYHQRKKR